MGTVAIVGAGRLGTALGRELRAAGVDVRGPLGRLDDEKSSPDDPRATRSDVRDAAVVLLCVPDRSISDAAALVPTGPLVGHCSGANGLEALAPHEAFSMHPLMTVTEGSSSFAGAAAAVDGDTDRALAAATTLAKSVGMIPVRVAPARRALYHAAASTASNYVTTVLSAAEAMARIAGIERRHLAPLVRATVDAWERDGSAALTGPIARGDEDTVAAQRAALATATPELLATWDALVAATRTLARR